MKNTLTKISLLFSILMFTAGSLLAQMNGTYTINPSGSGTRNYTTFSAAVSALSGSAGINGAVVFDVSASTFSQQVAIGTINGTSATNTITFKGAGASSTKLTFSATSSTARHTLSIGNGAKYITFRDMTIEGTSTTYAWPVHIYGTTMTDIKFVKCNISAPVSTSSVCTPVVMSNSTSSNTSGGTATRITIDSCAITGGYYGISAYGLTGTGTRVQDLVVSNNSIQNYYLYGMYLVNHNNFQIINNYLKSTTSTTSTYGIYSSSGYGFNNGGTTGYVCRIHNNTIDNTGTYGIYLTTFNGLSTGSNEVINNEILGNFRNTSTQYGIYTSSCNYVNIYHNTAMVSNSTTSTAAAWYNTSTSTYLSVRNNAFIGIGSTRPVYIATAPTNSTINNNNYWLWGGTSGNLIYWAGTNYDNTNFTSVGGANSFNVNQGWTSATNFTIKDGCINGANLGVTIDHNGNARNNPPDIGAYEANIASYDVGISALFSPVTPASPTSVVKALITNYGSSTVNNVDASYKVGTSSPNNESFNFSTALASCTSDTITFTNSASLSGCESFTLYSGLINSTQTDQNYANDTFKTTVGVGLSGTYTIGGSGANYTSVTAAVNALSCSGVSGPVTFLLNGQLFNEQIIIGNIAGTSATNTVTFKGAGMNSTTLAFSASVSDQRHTLRIVDGAKFIVFRDMTIAGYSTSNTFTVHLYGFNISDIRFSNCKITAPISTSTAVIPYVMSNSLTSFSTGGTTARVVVDSCQVLGGYYCVTGYGLSTNTTTRHQDFTLSNTLVTDYYYYGGYFVYHNNFQIIGNTFRPSSSATTSSYGIYASTNYADNNGGSTGSKARINNNITENNGTYGIYISSLSGLSSGNNEVINNIVRGDHRSTSTQYGLYTSSCSYLSVFHNSFAVKNSTTNTAVAWYNSSGSFFNVQNNNFIGNGTSRALYIASAPSSSTVDYNNYYLWGGTTGNLIYWAGTEYTNANYKTVGGANSYNANQGWPAQNDLTINDGCLNGANLGVSADINGSSRSTTPDLGAYELSTLGYDVVVSAIVSPVSPANPTSVVKLLVKNAGTNSVSNLDASFKAGSSSAVNESFSFSTSLATCASDTVTFTNTASITGCVNFRAYSGTINSTYSDQNNTNDTLSVQVGIAMSGTYTIGGSGANYSTINAALNDLRCGGINGPVTFLLAAQTFNEQLVIGNIPGSSSSNTVTFKGAGISATSISFAASLQAESHTVRFIDGASFVTFRDLTIAGTSTSYAWPVHVMGSSVSDVSIRNCRISAPIVASSNLIPVVMNNSTTSYSTSGTSFRVTIDSCTLSGGYFSVVSYGASGTTTRHHDFTISNSFITDYYYYGTYLIYQNNVQVIGNTFRPGSSSSTECYGAYTNYCYGYNNGGSTGYISRINGNIFENNGYMALYTYYFNGTGTGSASNEIINNVFKGDFRSSYPYPVYADYSTYVKFYHNTVALPEKANVDGAFYIYDGNYIDIQNNVFISNETTPGVFVDYPPTNSTWDYNDLYTWGGKSGNLVGWYDISTSSYIYYDNTNFKTVMGSNSINQDLGWKSLTDLVHSDGCTNATNLGVSTDIRGITRNNPPDFGAYEAQLFANDIGVSRVISPVSPASGTSTVKILVTNYGSNNVSSFDASFKAGSSSAINQNFTLSTALANCKSDSVTFSSSATLSGCVDFLAYTGIINGSATDQNTFNDTAKVQIGVPMSGTYTIGGSGADFPSVTAAYAALNCGGVSGPVVFKLNAQTFTEQLTLNKITGQSATNTITFQGAGMNATRISYFATTSGLYHTLKFEGSASNYIFRDLSIMGTNSSTAWPLHIIGNTVSDLRFSNCYISTGPSTSTAVIPVLLNNSTTSYAGNGTATRITLDSCTIFGGWGGVVAYGNTASNAVKHQDLVISNCNINAFYQYGIYSYYVVNPQFLNNNITADVSASTTSYGIYTSSNSAYNNGGSTGYISRISGNKIDNNGYYGIYLGSFTGLSTGQNEIYNNVIAGDQRYSSALYALYMASCTYTDVYHNTVAAGQSISSSYGALYVSSGSFLNIKNNTFIGYGNTPAVRIGSTPSSSSYDYNNYYNWTGGTVLFNNVGTDYNASNFKTVGGANSVNVHQGWTSLTDLRIGDGCIRGTSLGVAVDVNNTTRATVPNIGAYEIPTSAIDAGVTEIVAPKSPATGGANTVEVIVKNFGTAPVDTMEVKYQYGNNSPVSETFTLSTALNNCESDTFTFTSPVSLSGCNTLSAFVGKVDNKTDENSDNDTLTKNIGVGLSGSYTVAGASPDFNTLQEALDAINCAGLNGPVTLLVRPGVYNGQLNIGAIATSAANTLTIGSSTGIASDVVFTDSTTLTNSRHVVRFMGAKFITLRDVTVINRSKIYGWGIHIFGGSEDIRIVNCTISVDSVNSTSTSYIPVIVNGSDNGYTTGGYTKNITIDSCMIKYGYMGIDIYGVSSPSYPEGIRIKNNIITGNYLYGIYTVSLTDVLIENNEISNRTPNSTTSGYGIYCSSVGSYNSKPATRILSNKIYNIGLYGIYMTSSSGLATDSNKIINNMIGGGFRSTTTYGFYATSCNYFSFYNNSVFMKGGTGTTYGLYTTSSNYWGIKNNHFSVDASATSAGYAMYINTDNGHNIDFNNYYNPSGTVLLYRAASYTSSTYRVSYAGGDNSRNYAPSFMGDLDLRVSDACNMPRLGTPLNAVSTDREGNPRNVVAPEIGAHEPGGWNYDVAVTKLINPTQPTLGGVQSVSMLIKNLGSTAISSVDASFQWNGGSVSNQTFNFSTPLANCDSAVITFTSSVNINQCGLFSVWTGNINGSNPDNYTANNRLDYNLGKGLNGSYTIAGPSPDFATLNDAFDAILCAGLAGPTVLNITPGTYNGQWNIGKLGATQTNTLTIRSATGNPSDVVLTDSTTLSNSRHIVRLNGAEWVILRDVTIINRSNILGWGLHVFNQSKNCRVANCIISVDSMPSTSTNYIPVVINGSETSYSTGGYNQNIWLDSNQINYGYFGNVIYGVSSPYSEGIRFTSNYIHKPYVYGIYGITLTDLGIDKNLINNDNRTTSGYGIYLSSVSSFNSKPAPFITNNRIINPGSYGIYLTSSDGTVLNPGTIANNEIGTGYRSTGYGMYLSSSDYWNIHHNTVNISGGGSTCYGFFGTNSTFLNVRNNNFAVTDPGASTSSYAFYSTLSTGNLVNYNNYYNPRGTNLLYHTSNFTSSNYQSMAGGGTNSSNILPEFEGDFDLRMKDKCFTKGDTIVSVSVDRFGTSRNFNAPFVGMHEMTVYTNDAMAVSVIEPVNPVTNSTNYDVKVVVKNVGTGTITTLDVGYELGSTYQKQTITGINLAPCDTMHVLFTGAYQASFNIGVNRMRPFTANVNSTADQDNANDTGSVQFFCSNMSGSYTINPTGSGSSNFKSFGDVAQALMSCGISGSVTFTVAPGTYNDRFELAGIVNGASASNTITIDGVDPSTRILRFDGVSGSVNATVNLIGTKYVTIKNLGIQNYGITHAVGVRMAPLGTQANDSVTIQGCNISVPVQVTAFVNQSGIMMTNGASTPVAGNTVDNVNIIGNTITGGYYGIASYGDFTNRITNLSIRNNIVNDVYAYGIYAAYYHDSLVISGNKINNLGNGVVTNPYAIYSYFNNVISITGNATCNQNGGYGIYMYETRGMPGRPSVIANNMLTLGNPALTNTTYGIYCYYPNYVDIAHNSVVINTQSSTGGSGLIYYSTGTGYDNNNIVNNSFVNNGPGYAAYVSGSSNSTFQASVSRMDNNNYQSNGSYAFRFMNTIFNDLATWQSPSYAGPMVDSFSMMVDPEHLGSCNLHTYSFNLNDKGRPIASVTTDFDGETRNSSTPDIGADEYTPPSDNAKVVAVINPVAPAVVGSHVVSVVVENKGTNTLTSLNVNYKVNQSGSVKTFAWTGSLATGDRDTIDFSGANVYNLTAGVTDTLIAFSNMPNGVADGYTPDDTSRSRICAAYAGNYTLGTGGDFVNFNEASIALNTCGVSAPVYINIASGVYNEQVEIKAIPGAGATSMVTFQSATGKPEDVKLQFAATSAVNNYIVRLNQADYVKFRKLTFEAKGNSSWGSLVHITGSGNQGSDYNVFEGNIFKGLNTNSTSNLMSLINTSSDNNEYNTFSGNTFLYGSMGIYFPGYAVNPLYSKGWLIESNTFDSISYMDMYLYYTEKFKIKNNILFTNTSYTGHYGMYILYPSNGIEISGNNIQFDQSATYPILMQYHNNNYGTDTAWIYNNFISWDFGSASNYAFYSYSNRNLMFLHNSVNTTGSSTSGVYYYATASDNGVIMNNILKSRNYSFYVANTPPTISDYNNYYTGVNNLVYYLGNRNSLASLEGAYYFGSDANSKIINPMFLTNGNLRPTNSALINSGVGIGILTDIDGDSRNSSTPSMGAEEIKGDLIVASIVGMTDTACNRGQESVSVILKNGSFVQLSNFQLKMEVNGGTPITENFSGTINSGDSASYTFTAKAGITKVGLNSIKITGLYSNDDNLTNNEANISVVNADNPKPSFTYRDTCYQKPLTMNFTGTVSVGNISQIDWNFNNGNTATGTMAYQAYPGVGPYIVTVTATSDLGCVATINEPVRVLSDLVAGTIGSSQTICYNVVPVALSSTVNPSGSGGTYLYQWESSSDGVNFSDISGATNYAYQPPALTDTVWYRRRVSTSLGCGPKMNNTVVINTYTPIAAGSVGTDQTICYNTIPATIAQSTAPSGGDGSFTYRWESSVDNTNWQTVIGATNANYTPGRLTTTTYYRRQDIAGSNCGTRTTNTVKITVYDELKPGTFTGSFDICPNGDPGTFNQNTAPSGGNGSFTYQWQQSGNGSTWTDISGATNTAYAPGSVSSTTYFRRNVTSGGGCGTADGTGIIVNVRALPRASFSTSFHCFGDKVPLVNSSTPGFGIITDYAWNFEAGGNANVESPTYVYGTDGSKTVKLVVTNSLGCKDSTTRTTFVSKVPQASYVYFYDCASDSLRFKSTTSINCGTILAYHWNFGDGTTSNMENPSKKFAAGTYNVKFKIDFSGGISDSVIQVITVYPKGNLDFNAPDVCYNDLSKFTNTSANAASYFWDFGDNFTSNATSPDHLYATSGNYTVKLTAISLNGCNLSVTKSHTVKVRPDADIVTDDRCLGDTTPFSNGSLYSHSYAWYFGDGNGSTLNEPKHLYSASGNYTVKLVATNNNGCVDSTTSTAVVHALPVANFTASNSCAGKDIVFYNTSTGAVSYSWNLGDGSSSAIASPVYQYPNAGTYTITLMATSGFGCKNSITKTLDIYPRPTADFSTANVCAGSSASFTNKSTISSGTVSYVWHFGDGNTSTQVSPNYTYASAGVYTVKLVATSGNGCADSMERSITIHSGAVANFTSSNACLGQVVNFSNTSTNANSYTWTFGDGNGSSNMSPTHTYNAVGNYTVTLTANNSNGCSSVISKVVQVNAVPTAAFTAANVCLGTATNFVNNSTIGSGTMSYTWDFGNGATSNSISPSYTYPVAGTYNVILTVTSNNACAVTTTRTVSVYSNPVSDFTTSNVCVGSNLQFVNNSSSGTYAWNFGDGGNSTSANPSHTYNTAGTYTVTLTVLNGNGCSTVSSKVVTVYALPTTDFTSTTVCAGNATAFTNISTGAISYNWQFGDGGSSTLTNPTYTYPNAGSYMATLISTNSNGCKSQISKSVTVNAVPSASFTTADVCLGTAANFTNTSTGTGNTYNWLFGDGGSATTTNASRNYAATGAYNVTLTATNGVGCSNVASKTVNVFAVPVAAFTSSDQCLGSNMVFTNQSTGATLYNWQFGDGTSSPLTNPVKGYSAMGAYNVTLTATNNNKCSNSVTKVVNINPNPVASFTGTPICTSNTAQMNNTSTISSGTMTFNWNFGDGNSSTLAAPSHTFPAEGTYVVTLTASSGAGCQSTAQNTVSVAPVPVADFSANEVCLGGTTVFTNSSTGDASASWMFGDATNSSLLSPVHTYSTAGTFNVSLTVTSKYGCVSSINKPVTVNPNPTSAFTATNACQGTPVNITNSSTGAASYEWYYGYVGPDKTTTPNVILDNPGTTIIRLVAISNKGCRHESSRNVEVYTSPKAEFSVMKTCQGDQTLFVNKSLNAGSYNWQFGDGNNSGNNNPSHQYAGAGTYKVVLTANNAQCSNQFTMDVVVNPLPSADFNFSTSGKEVTFTSVNKTNVKAYDWNFGDGTFGDVADPKHLYNNAIVQVFNVCLNVTDNLGCQSEVCKNVSVNLLGKEEVELSHSKVVVYPNPNRGEFSVYVAGSQDRAQVEVVNLLGVKVADAQSSGEDTYHVITSGLSEGAYLVKVTFEGKSSVHRIMIAK